jgi:hypothetical protein
LDLSYRRSILSVYLFVFIAVLSGCGGASNNAEIKPSSITITITVQPVSQAISAGQTATFSVTANSVAATGMSDLGYQWQKNGTNIPNAVAATYTTPTTTTGDSGGQFTVSVSDSGGSLTSNPAALIVNPIPTASNTDVATYHYDNLRTGQNLHEKVLTPANVNPSKFGKLGSFAVDGLVDAQPLYLSEVAIPGNGIKNVLYVVTEHGTVYAFDADSVSGTSNSFLWKSSTVVAPETSAFNPCPQILPEIGITSTPVIDRKRGAIYVVAMTQDSSGNQFQKIHALDLGSGKELFGGPTTITATYPGSGANSSNGSVAFDPKQYKERAALLEANGMIYTTWSSHCDAPPYTSWLIAYSADTLKQSAVLNLVPNGNDGGIWMAGAGPGADAAGNVYFMIGNGDFDTNMDSTGLPVNGNCGNCFVKISSTTPLKLLDYFTPDNTFGESATDTDLGSGGPVLLPDVVDASGNTRHLAVGSGKDGIIYVVDRDNMGEFNAGLNNNYQTISGQLAAGVWAKPSYFNSTVYYGAIHDAIKAFPIANGMLAVTPSSQSATQYPYPGASMVISANNTTNGIVWAVENNNNGVLHAYDAANLATELYNSNAAANGRDVFGGNKFITPTVANSKVFVGTPNSVAVFGLLP